MGHIHTYTETNTHKQASIHQYIHTNMHRAKDKTEGGESLRSISKGKEIQRREEIERLSVKSSSTNRPSGIWKYSK